MKAVAQDLKVRYNTKDEDKERAKQNHKHVEEESEGLSCRFDSEHERENIGEWEDTEREGKKHLGRSWIVLSIDVEEKQ